MKLLSLFAFLLLFSTSLNAQKYGLAAGLRLGTEYGVSLSGRVGNKVTIETLIQTSPRNKRATCAMILKKHNSLIGKRINFFVGAGPHLSWTSGNNGDINQKYWGVTPIAGIEVSVGRLNLAWDYKPQIDLTGGDTKLNFDNQTAITVRYIFIKRTSKVFKKEFWQFWKK